MLIRIEPIFDDVSQRYFLAIYFPVDATRPFVTTVPRYASAGAAEQDAIAILASRASTAEPPSAVIAAFAGAALANAEQGA